MKEGTYRYFVILIGLSIGVALWTGVLLVRAHYNELDRYEQQLQSIGCGQPLD